MKASNFARKPREAQTLVFFLIAWGLIMLLCGLAIDSGLLYLAKARLGRAVDGAALAAVGNFNRNSSPTANRDAVALIMRNFAVANFTDLSSVATSGSGTSGGVATQTTGTNGQTATSYVYNFNDGTTDANGQYRRFVQVTLNTGSGGNITSANCNARCPVQTYFIGYATYAMNGRQNVKIGGYSGPSSLVDLKVSSSAVATRNPRLIMVVIDRSASMLLPGGGASGLPPAVVQFLDFFDTSSDFIGIVSFGSSARLEMPLTTNFIIAGTNSLIDAYETNSSGGAIPGEDPELDPTDARYDPNYATTGVRRLKFGGQTAADEGIRLGMEQMMANSGFSDPDVIKYMVIFTDGKWNASRSLFAAPGYTNEMIAPVASTYVSYTGITNGLANGMTNGQYPGPWTNLWGQNTNLVVMPSLGKLSTRSTTFNITNALNNTNLGSSSSTFSPLLDDHTNDWWQSVDGSGLEPLGAPTGAVQGAPAAITNETWVAASANGLTNYYTHNVDVWLTPGSTAYYYSTLAATTPSAAYVSDLTDSDRHINVNMAAGSRMDLVVPGYIVDGIVYDGIDLAAGVPEDPLYPRYRLNNYHEAFMWPDDTSTFNANTYAATSIQMQLMFRNYPNLLTGFYVFRPDEPLSTATEPLDDTTPATKRPLYGLGPYYPSAGFYWPFDLIGVDYDATYALRDPTTDPDPDNNQAYTGGSRHVAYSINMSSAAAAPAWAGELFYKSVSGGGTGVYSGTGSTSASTLMTSSDWKAGAPAWLSDFTSVMTNEPTHNTTISGSPSVWRPSSFTGDGSQVSLTTIKSLSDPANLTGGYVGNNANWANTTSAQYYRNAMAWSGRPTHYFDFSQAKWVAIGDNHHTNIEALPLGNWKAREYAWHARALGVTIYTVGYGTLVTDAQQAFLAQLANATNTTAGGGSNITYNASQPIGQQFYATNATQISNDFYQVGQAINEALTQ